jgi:hypothetical protein
MFLSAPDDLSTACFGKKGEKMDLFSGENGASAVYDQLWM